MNTSKTLSAIALFSLLSACSPKRMAVNAIGNALAGGSSGWSSDDDPELVADATPFALKTIESLLASSPKNENLLLAASSGFTSYSFAFIEAEADYTESSDRPKAVAMRARAKKLYLRARDYGIRGLEVRHPGLRAEMAKDQKAALEKVKKKSDVPMLYWTAASWAAAISLDKTDASLSSDLPLVAAMMKRCLALDETWGGGAIWDFFISYDAGLPAAAGGSIDRAKTDLDKSLAISKGKRAAPLVSWAEGALVAKQDRKEFERILKQALAIDPNGEPSQRLPNLLSQKRARWLLAREDELFLE